MFAIIVSYGRCHDSPTCACAPMWKTYGRSSAGHEVVADQVVDRRLVGQIGEDDVSRRAAPMLLSAPDEVARTNAITLRVERDERLGQVRPDEPVGAGDEARAAAVRVAELGPQGVELGSLSRWLYRRRASMQGNRSRTISSGILTGISTAAVSGSAAVAGVILSRKFGHGVKTDGFLPPTPSISRSCSWRASLRVVVLPRFVRARRATDGWRRRSGTWAAALAVPLARGGRRVTALVRTGSRRCSPASPARGTLRPQLLPWLIASAAAQVLGGVVASALAAFDDYVDAAFGFARRRGRRARRDRSR